MKIQDSLDMQGRLTLRLIDREGQVVATRKARNAIVNEGRELAAKQLFYKNDIEIITHFGIGSSTEAVKPSDPDLLDPILRKPINEIQDTHITTSQTTNKTTVRVTGELDFQDATDRPITEAGLFNAESGDSMYNRVVFDPIHKSEDYKLTLVWEIIF